MSTLMVCRQIKNIELENNLVIIYSDDESTQALISNDKHKRELNEFFNSRGLSYKVFENKKESNDLDDLKMIFGDKLKLK